jgi:D-alanyl-D-alanine carboxypeptidase/D-alanyl-D-alanine-endopeptidase (penicillin-binding protein 4)
MSRKDLLSASAISTLLQFAYNDASIKEDFIAAFPISGMEGTVKNRFKEAHSFKILAKSGSADNTSSLSGYVFNDKGKAYAFSIICNGFTSDRDNIKKLEEEILLDAINSG